jgi:hypothetical protein
MVVMNFNKIKTITQLEKIEDPFTLLNCTLNCKISVMLLCIVRHLYHNF